MHLKPVQKRSVRFPLLRGERGVSLLEILFSVVVLGIVVLGYISTLGMVINTSDIVFDANTLSSLAFSEMEQLRSLEFGEVPFYKPDTAGALEEVPNYYKNILTDMDGLQIITTGDLIGYDNDYAVDGLRADDTTNKWVAQRNLLTNGVSEGPDADGPYDPDDPGGSGGDGGPGGGGPGGLPEGYQYWLADLGAEYKISRILYDNRFNVYEALGIGLDRRVHSDDVWQKKWRFFYRETELAFGEPIDPRYNVETLYNFFGGKYGSTGVNVIWDDPENPLYAGLLGVTEIDTYSDFDSSFHWPYVSEIEVYGYDTATSYLRTYTDSDGETSFYNVIMYFPNYKNSGLDLGRRVYVPIGAAPDGVASRYDLFRIELEFYPYQKGRNTTEWMKETWWQDDESELSKFMSSFYRDRVTRLDNLPLIPDLPNHTIYADNEDFYIEYIVPGATSVRFLFSEFDLQADASSDYVQFFDAEGTLYGKLAYFGRPGDPDNLDQDNMYGPWVEGDTIVIHFHSDGQFNSNPPESFGGFKVERVEIHTGEELE